jgi:hypothetical protein
MKKLPDPIFRVGCLTSVVAPIAAIVFYPRANWIFAFLFLGIVLVVVGILTRKESTPAEIAAQAERLLSGDSLKWDVDDYEHRHPRDPKLKGLWLRTMEVGLPETWWKMEQEERNTLRKIIEEIRKVGTD